jgi:hypothetical protein
MGPDEEHAEDDQHDAEDALRGGDRDLASAGGAVGTEGVLNFGVGFRRPNPRFFLATDLGVALGDKLRLHVSILPNNLRV